MPLDSDWRRSLLTPTGSNRDQRILPTTCLWVRYPADDSPSSYRAPALCTRAELRSLAGDNPGQRLADPRGDWKSLTTELRQRKGMEVLHNDGAIRHGAGLGAQGRGKRQRIAACQKLPCVQACLELRASFYCAAVLCRFRPPRCLPFSMNFGYHDAFSVYAAAGAEPA